MFDHILLQARVQRLRQSIMRPERTITPGITEVREPRKFETSLQFQRNNVVNERKGRPHQPVRPVLVRSHESIDRLDLRSYPGTKWIWCSGPHWQGDVA